MNNIAVTFDDILIKPKFSKLSSRKYVDLTTDLGKEIKLSLPVISANMSTITGPKMAHAMSKAGGMGIFHRFMTIEENITAWTDGPFDCGVSIGVVDSEKERAEALIDAGANIICVDVAHGAQQSVVDQVKWLRSKYKDNIFIIVGNFATPQTIKAFGDAVGITDSPDIYKVGIGPGSVCTTRIKTGVGVPQLSAILSCAAEFPIIADGGMKTPGDIAKALAGGAKAVMLGGMLAGTKEAPGEEIIGEAQVISYEEAKKKAKRDNIKDFSKVSISNGYFFSDGFYAFNINPEYKIYKGSAANGYGNGWKTSEGVEIKVPYKGPVEPILKDIEGGLRSSFTYTGASNLNEFQNNAELIIVSPSTRIENKAHGG